MKCLVQCLIHSGCSIIVFFTRPTIVLITATREDLWATAPWAHALAKKMKPLSLLLNFPWTLSISFFLLTLQDCRSRKKVTFPPFFSHACMYAFIHLSIHSTNLYWMPSCSRHHDRYWGYNTDHLLWSLFFRGSQKMMRWPGLLAQKNREDRKR